MTDNTGTILRDPDFHDGRLTGISIESGVLDLTCSDVTGKRYRVRLTGTTRLRADNFLQGNIIFELLVFKERFPHDLLKRVFGEDTNADPPWLAKEVDKLAAGDWTLLQLTSSYGCELLALGSGAVSVTILR